MTVKGKGTAAQVLTGGRKTDDRKGKQTLTVISAPILINVTPDPRIPTRASKKKYPPKAGKPRRVTSKAELMQYPTCPHCGARFSDIRSRDDHTFFCRLKHEREQGVQQ